MEDVVNRLIEVVKERLGIQALKDEVAALTCNQQAFQEWARAELQRTLDDEEARIKGMFMRAISK